MDEFRGSRFTDKTAAGAVDRFLERYPDHQRNCGKDQHEQDIPDDNIP